MYDNKWKYYIDKTEQLEKGIIVFPSIYIEGSAACGKSAAVQMLSEKYPEKNIKLFHMEEACKQAELFLEKIEAVSQEVKVHDLWIVFDNMPENLPDSILQELVRLVKNLPENSRVIFTGRGKPGKALLELLWKRKMELITAQELLFSRKEIGHLAGQWKSRMDVEQIYEKTGGWPGCVDLLFRLEEQDQRSGLRVRNVEELLNSYEISSYIEQEILSKLSQTEGRVLAYAAGCSWLTIDLCSEIWNFEEQKDPEPDWTNLKKTESGQVNLKTVKHDEENLKTENIKYLLEVLENLTRKGILIYEKEKERWKIHPLFFCYLSEETTAWSETAADWYAKQGYVGEALQCLKKNCNKDAYRRFLVKHYDKIPFSGQNYEAVKEWSDKSAPACYLRGMYYYSIQNFAGLEKEIHILEKNTKKDRQTWEILLNLYFIKPDFSLEQWLKLLEKTAEEEKEKSFNTEKEIVKFRLYHILGNSCTFLCGLRDLSGLFACMKKEENQRANIWKEHLGQQEWEAYQLARLDYYLETGRKNAIREDDRALLEKKTEMDSKPADQQFSQASLYLLNKLQAFDSESNYMEQIRKLENQFQQEENQIWVKNADAITSLYSGLYGERERMIRWLRNTVQESNIEIKESNYILFYCQVKIYMMLDQYKQADRILKKLISYCQAYHRSRFLAELLFQQALVVWSEGVHSQSLRSVIGSFLVTGSIRYTVFYTEYGKMGRDVLESYIEWMKNNYPEKWRRKKKYNYGNVLRMPVEDYMEVILRGIRKNISKEREKQEYVVTEKLTIMEISVLQSIGHGMTNAQICEQLDLKLPTVKSHIYNLYKKLGVKTRVQAILKGKEMGILE